MAEEDEFVAVFLEQEFKAYFWKAQLHQAVDYLRGFPNQRVLLDQYFAVFENGPVLQKDR